MENHSSSPGSSESCSSSHRFAFGKQCLAEEGSVTLPPSTENWNEGARRSPETTPRRRRESHALSLFGALQRGRVTLPPYSRRRNEGESSSLLNTAAGRRERNAPSKKRPAEEGRATLPRYSARCKEGAWLSLETTSQRREGGRRSLLLQGAVRRERGAPSFHATALFFGETPKDRIEACSPRTKPPCLRATTFS
jgi:hypothetical protein